MERHQTFTKNDRHVGYGFGFCYTSFSKIECGLIISTWGKVYLVNHEVAIFTVKVRQNFLIERVNLRILTEYWCYLLKYLVLQGLCLNWRLGLRKGLTGDPWKPQTRPIWQINWYGPDQLPDSFDLCLNPIQNGNQVQSKLMRWLHVHCY